MVEPTRSDGERCRIDLQMYLSEIMGNMKDRR